MALPLWLQRRACRSFPRGPTPFACSMLPDEAKLSSLRRAAAYSAVTVHFTPRPMVCGGSDSALRSSHRRWAGRQLMGNSNTR